MTSSTKTRGHKDGFPVIKILIPVVRQLWSSGVKIYSEEFEREIVKRVVKPEADTRRVLMGFTTEKYHSFRQSLKLRVLTAAEEIYADIEEHRKRYRWARTNEPVPLVSFARVWDHGSGPDAVVAAYVDKYIEAGVRIMAHEDYSNKLLRGYPDLLLLNPDESSCI